MPNLCTHCGLPTERNRYSLHVQVPCPECQIEAAALVQADREEITPEDLEEMMVPVNELP